MFWSFNLFFFVAIGTHVTPVTEIWHFTKTCTCGLKAIGICQTTSTRKTAKRLYMQISTLPHVTGHSESIYGMAVLHPGLENMGLKNPTREKSVGFFQMSAGFIAELCSSVGV